MQAFGKYFTKKKANIEIFGIYYFSLQPLLSFCKLSRQDLSNKSTLLERESNKTLINKLL